MLDNLTFGVRLSNINKSQPCSPSVGVEAKASLSLHANDLRGLHGLAAAAGGKFVRGVILYLGEQVIPFAHNIHAVPITALWANS